VTGLVFAIVLVYLLIVVNFQSWLDPFIILTALPANARGNRVVLVCDRHDDQPYPRLPDRLCALEWRLRTASWWLASRKNNSCRTLCCRSGRAGRIRAIPAGADDGSGNDHRNAPYGHRVGRRWRTECTSRRAVIGGLLFATVSTLFFRSYGVPVWCMAFVIARLRPEFNNR